MKIKNASAPDTSLRITRIHWLLSVIGVVTAVICSIVLLRDLQPKQEESSQSASINMPATSSLNQEFDILARVSFQSLNRIKGF